MRFLYDLPLQILLLFATVALAAAYPIQHKQNGAKFTNHSFMLIIGFTSLEAEIPKSVSK